MAGLVRSHALRFTMFAAWSGAGAVSQALDNFPLGWLVIWFGTSLLLALLTRVLMARYVRRLQRQGVLTEVIAVVGAGPVADRLVQALRQTRPETIELLGVFDDKILGAVPSTIKSAGTLAQLIELGKTRKIDWILLTLPPTAEHRLLSIVQRLKALSVPIGLCPQHVGLTVPYRTIDYVGDSVPVSLLADRPIKRWDAVIREGVDLTVGGSVVAAAAAGSGDHRPRSSSAVRDRSFSSSGGTPSTTVNSISISSAPCAGIPRPPLKTLSKPPATMTASRAWAASFARRAWMSFRSSLTSSRETCRWLGLDRML
jgi:hypothetical protein